MSKSYNWSDLKKEVEAVILEVTSTNPGMVYPHLNITDGGELQLIIEIYSSRSLYLKPTNLKEALPKSSSYTLPSLELVDTLPKEAFPEPVKKNRSYTRKVRIK